jgi:hypothetical protein
MFQGEELKFKVVRADSYEVVAYAANLLVGQAAYQTARRMFPTERVDLRDGALVIARSDQESERRP